MARAFRRTATEDMAIDTETTQPSLRGAEIRQCPLRLKAVTHVRYGLHIIPKVPQLLPQRGDVQGDVFLRNGGARRRHGGRYAARREGVVRLAGQKGENSELHGTKLERYETKCNAIERRRRFILFKLRRSAGGIPCEVGNVRVLSRDFLGRVPSIIHTFMIHPGLHCSRLEARGRSSSRRQCCAADHPLCSSHDRKDGWFIAIGRFGHRPRRQQGCSGLYVAHHRPQGL